jgi:hypothetical protein
MASWREALQAKRATGDDFVRNIDPRNNGYEGEGAVQAINDGYDVSTAELYHAKCRTEQGVDLMLEELHVRKDGWY